MDINGLALSENAQGFHINQYDLPITGYQKPQFTTCMLHDGLVSGDIIRKVGVDANDDIP